MRKFAFQELAYAIVVATAYGMIIGWFFNEASDFWILFIWVLFFCAHLGGIWLIVHLEERKQEKVDKRKEKKMNAER
ncbi:MAG: hypothetical protein ACFE95_11575 [Candidatus Hodarchaeota archaeon]